MVLPSLTIVLAAQPWLAEETASTKIRARTDNVAVATREVLGRIRLTSNVFRVDHGFQHIRVRAVVSGLRAGFCGILAQAPPRRRWQVAYLGQYRAEARRRWSTEINPSPERKSREAVSVSARCAGRSGDVDLVSVRPLRPSSHPRWARSQCLYQESTRRTTLASP